MAQAANGRMSAVRQRHAAHPTRPKPASKPGVPSSAHLPSADDDSEASPDVPESADVPPEDESADDPRDSDDAERSGSGDDAGLPELSLPGGGGVTLPRPHLSLWTRLAVKIVKRVAQHELRKHPELTKLPELAKLPELGKFPELGKLRELDLSALRPGLPIQYSIDIAVPLEFAWQKWMELSFLPEGLDQVVDIERDGEELSGRLDGDSGSSWSAQILDEREQESFAWRSQEGSDCAGLVTFHRLSDRLTRLELSLDVVPLSAMDAVRLLVRLADWRAGREMRRFKADLEVISPEVYADGDSAAS